MKSFAGCAMILGNPYNHNRCKSYLIINRYIDAIAELKSKNFLRIKLAFQVTNQQI